MSEQEKVGIYGTEPLFYIGLLTNEQKRAGYFVAQDEDFIHIFHKGNNGIPRVIAILPYEEAKVKEIRDKTEADRLSSEKDNGINKC